MAEMKPETKIERLAAKMKPLADWFEKNKPAVETIRITSDEMKLLSDNPEIAVGHGFFVSNGKVKWRTFEIKSA